MSNAEIMREKQRQADLKKQGIDPNQGKDADKKKDYDTSFMDQYKHLDSVEETKDGHREEEDRWEETKDVKSDKPLTMKQKLLMQ